MSIKEALEMLKPSFPDLTDSGIVLSVKDFIETSCKPGRTHYVRVDYNAEKHVLSAFNLQGDEFLQTEYNSATKTYGSFKRLKKIIKDNGISSFTYYKEPESKHE